MSDIQSNAPSSTEPLPIVEAGSAEEGKPIESGTPLESNPSANISNVQIAETPPTSATAIPETTEVPNVPVSIAVAASASGTLSSAPAAPIAVGTSPSAASSAEPMSFEQRVEERFMALETALMHLPQSIATVMARGSQEPADFAKSVLAHLFGKE